MEITAVQTIDPVGKRAMQGDIGLLPLPELLQFLHINGRDGVLVLSDEEGKPRAMLSFVGTQIVSAACDGIQGAEAVYAAMSHQSGHFEFVQGTSPSPPAVPIRESVQNLILEGLRRLDELSHMTTLLPADDKPLFLAPEPPQDDIRLTAREWSVLSLVNGKRNVRQIVETSKRDESEARSTLVALLTADLIVDRRDDSHLDRIVPRALRQEEAATVRYAPPTLLGNLLLKSCDGRSSLRAIAEKLHVEPKAMLEELQLLLRTRWITFAEGEDDYRRFVEPE